MHCYFLIFFENHIDIIQISKYYCIKVVIQQYNNTMLGVEIMSWELKNDRPIYTQLMDQITLKIVSGEYKSGEKLPSVRDLAAEAAVNPNTMQKALTELERINLVYSVRTSGRFITEDIEMIKDMQENLAKDEIKEFLKKMEKIGFEKDRTLKIVEQVMKEMK